MHFMLILLFHLVASNVYFSSYSAIDTGCQNSNGTLSFPENKCVFNGTFSFQFSCGANSVNMLYCTDSSCLNCTKLVFTSDICYINQYFSLIGNSNIKPYCSSTDPIQYVGQYIYQYSPGCGPTADIKFFGTSNCQKKNYYSTSRVYCDNNQLIEEYYSSSLSCLGRFTTQTRYSSTCSNGITLTACFQPSNEGTWWFSFTFIFPICGILIVIVLYLNRSLILAFFELIKLDINGVLKYLRINELFSLNTIKVKEFYSASHTRTALTVFYLFLMTEYFVLSILLFVWRQDNIVCPNYGFISSSGYFFFVYGYFTFLITFSLIYNMSNFCTAFYYSTGETTRAFLSFTGIYQFDSKYYLEWTDYGTIIFSVIFIIITIPSSVIGIIFTSLNFSQNGLCEDVLIPVIGILSMVPILLDLILLSSLVPSLIYICKKNSISLPTPTLPTIELPNIELTQKHENPEIHTIIVKQWNKDHIKEWLKDIGLSQYYSKLSFVPIEAFPTIDIKDISQAGIDDPFHQKSLLCAAKNLNLISFYSPNERYPITWNSEMVRLFLEKQIHNSKEITKKYCLNGAYLVNMDENEILNILEIDYSKIGEKKKEFFKYAITKDPLFYKSDTPLGRNCDEVCKWLEELGFSAYKKKFKKLNIFGGLVPLLNSPECFNELGIQEIHFKSFRFAIESFTKQIQGVSFVKNWIKETKIGNDLIEYVNSNCVHLYYLLSLKENDIDDIFPPLKFNSLKKKAFIEQLKKLRNEYNFQAPHEDILQPSISSDVPIISPQPNAPKVEELEEEKLCKICFDNPKCMLTIPCRHICMCENCSSKVKDCPICRTNIEYSMKVYSV